MTRRPKTWYKSKKQYSRQTRPTLIINNTVIVIGTDPRDGFTEENAKRFDAWINVADTPCNSLSQIPWKTERYWFPVAEIHRWTYNHAYWIKNLMDALVFERKDIKSIYIHCHAGAKRSPTSLIMWLMSRYGLDEALSLVYPEEEDKKSWRGLIKKSIKKGGRYKELPPQLELFYKLLKHNGKYSLEHNLLEFNTLTKNKHIQELGSLYRIRENLKYKDKRTRRSSYIKDFSETMSVCKKTLICSCKGKRNLSWGKGLYEANKFYEKHNPKFSKAWFYGWYGTEILKRSSWMQPRLNLKNPKKGATKGNIEVIELKELLDKQKYTKITTRICRKKNALIVKEVKE